MGLTMGDVAIERRKYFEMDCDGGCCGSYAVSRPTIRQTSSNKSIASKSEASKSTVVSPTVKYFISNRTMKDSNGDIVLIEKVDKKNPSSADYDENVLNKKTLVDDFKGSRGLINGILCSTFGNVTQFKEKRTNSFNRVLNTRRDLKHEYLFYRHEIIKLKTELKFAQREIPISISQSRINEINQELNDMNAGLSVVRKLIKDIDSNYPLINMEKEMRIRESKSNGSTIFQEVIESDCKISSYELELEKLEKQIDVRSLREKEELGESVRQETKVNVELRKMAYEELKKRIA